MTNANNHFFSHPKIQNLVIHFAFRIPIRKELGSGERKTLENQLRDLDNEFFQLFDDPQQKKTGTFIPGLATGANRSYNGNCTSF
ncbi:MAG: hypothetical protein HY762_07155 [Planctomycetes bacterium]|nr:hypothetical protein [Planctomycetota bacterium]